MELMPGGDGPRGSTGRTGTWVAMFIAAVVVLLIAGVFVLLRTQGRMGGPAAGGAATPSRSPATPATPTGPTGPATRDTPTSPASPTPPAAHAVISGRLVYTDLAGGRLRRLLWEGGPVRTLPRTSYTAMDPRGRMATWFALADGRGDVLHVGTLTGTDDRVLAAGFDPVSACRGAAWSPDGDRIAFTYRVRGTLHTDLIGADGGGRAGLAGPGLPCLADWSADGRYLVGTSTGRTSPVFLYDLRSGRRRWMPVAGDHIARDLSPDGGKVVVSSFDPAESRSSVGVYDTGSGRRYALPVRGRVVAAFFQPDGRLLVRVLGQRADALLLLDPDLRTRLASVREPAELRDTDLIGFAPTGVDQMEVPTT